MKFTILVNAYNVEDYISEALHSAMNQKVQNLEIIVIDDNSTDSTFQIIEKIARLDSRIRVLRTGTNQGISAARNEALKFATGDFLAFLDGDDVLVSGFLNRIEQAVTQHPLTDLVLFNFERFDDEKITAVSKVGLSFDKAYTAIWNKVYSRGLYKSMRFPAGVTLGEDTSQTLIAFYESNHPLLITDTLYRYRQRNYSATTISKSLQLLEALFALEPLVSLNNHLQNKDLQILLNSQFFSFASNAVLVDDSDSKDVLKAIFNKQKELNSWATVYNKNAIKNIKDIVLMGIIKSLPLAWSKIVVAKFMKG